MSAVKITDLLGSYDNSDEEPSFLNHPQNILWVTITCMIVSWVCACMRLYTRYFIVHSPGWDDVFVILSLISTSVGSAGICAAATMGGMGRHYLSLSVETMIEYLKIFYVANASYPTSTALIKMALLFQYLRVYEKGSKTRIATIATIVVVALWGVAYSILSWVPTVPVNAYWDLTMPATRYAYGSIYVEPFVAVYSSHAASNMVLDMIILLLAAPILVYNKASNERSRWSLLCLFSIGSIASIISIFRLASILRTRAATLPTFDPTWYGATPIVLAALEVDIATITAALPVFWPVLRNLSLNIQVTREVKVTMEHRRLSSGRTTDEDAIELQRADSGLPKLHHKTSGKDYYQDKYIRQQVDPLRDEDFGGTTEIAGARLPGRTTSIRKKMGMEGLESRHY